MIQRFALHLIQDTDFLNFKAEEYSRFKFGDNIIARNFGHDLATGFIEKYFVDSHPVNQIVVISSPYCFIPTATHALTNQFVYTLNHWLADNELLTVQVAKVHRTITYKEDYGQLSAKQRMELIENDDFHIDKDFLQNKTLIFLDDIRITGSHEAMIIKMMDSYKIKNETYLLYFANLVNTQVEPQFENYLNYYSVKSIFDLTDIIQADFAINTRIVKYILGYDYDSFVVFIQQQNDSFLSLLHNMALGNNYHLIDFYKKNLLYTKQLLELNKSIEILA